MSWRDAAFAIIAQVDCRLPDDADIKTRKRALREACPYEFRTTSWGRKVWGKEATSYLIRHGMHPRARLSLPESPLEREKRRSATT